jgi:hypothetical protein
MQYKRTVTRIGSHSRRMINCTFSNEIIRGVAKIWGVRLERLILDMNMKGILHVFEQ